MMAKFSDWLDARSGLRTWLRAKKAQAVPAHSFFFCFGGISLLIIILQVVGGIFMLFYYTPDPKEALNSIDYMSNEVPLGWLVRNMHRWGATLLLASVFTHLVTVFYRKAYRNPRELNWISGVLQFFVVFLLVLSGIILPWDWRAYWSYSIWVDYVATWPLVGDFMKAFVLDTFTIYRSSITHIVILPLILFALLAFHFKMVRKHGISEPL